MAMAKVSVTLCCTWDNGREKKDPGQTVSMDEAQAAKLADMGFVMLSGAAPKPVKAAKIRVSGRDSASESPDKEHVDGLPALDSLHEVDGLPDPDDLLADPSDQE